LLFQAYLVQFFRIIVAARKNLPVYRITIATPALQVIRSEIGRMPQIHGFFLSVMPSFVQSEQTILNAISVSGFYVRGGLDSFGLPAFILVVPC
jgi:hypothetical protein